MTTLRDRCLAFYQSQSRNAMLRQGDPVQTILEFVVSEIGRNASPSLDKTLPLCLYFPTAEDRECFIAAVKEEKPSWISRRVL